MADMTGFLKTDLVDDHVAADVNKLILASLRAEHANTETISATKELTDNDCPYQVITASGADRTVELAPEATTNHPTIVYNAGASNNVVVKDDAGAVTFITLATDEWAVFIPVNGETWKVLENRSTLKTYFDTLYSSGGNNPGPQGGMINGKLSVSVASNNLTVALKTLAGDDPSAGDPVYVRINGAIRTLTAALSVTKNAGTNWCNAGASEHATLEIDYFVYLGYNATDGVVIGFSRFPGATRYDGFSATSTNEKYCAISTITNAAAGDYYEVIGRFAATLSAGAGYTWSVPTFTAENLIDRPIHETRWLNWTPTLTGFSSNPTDTVYKYHVRYNTLTLFVRQLTPGTSNATTLTITLPFVAKTITNMVWQSGGAVEDNGTVQTTVGRIQLLSGGSTITVYKDMGATAFTASGNKRLLQMNPLIYEI